MQDMSLLCIYVKVCLSLIEELSVGGLRCNTELQESDLYPSSCSSIPWPGVRLSALSIILALCGIPRIPRPTMCKV